MPSPFNGFGAVVEVAYGDLTASYVKELDLVNADDPITPIEVPRYVHIRNNTNTELYVSFDGTNDHLKLAAAGSEGNTRTLRLKEDRIRISTNSFAVHLKYDSAPASGEVLIEYAS